MTPEKTARRTDAYYHAMNLLTAAKQESAWHLRSCNSEYLDEPCPTCHEQYARERTIGRRAQALRDYLTEKGVEITWARPGLS